MISTSTTFIGILLIILIFLRSPDEIQFRKQISPISGLFGNATPNTVKNRFDQFIFILVIILIFLQILAR